jgi:hypothetical protein
MRNILTLTVLAILVVAPLVPEKASADPIGKMVVLPNFLPKCGTRQTPEGSIVRQLGGSSASHTKMCICTSDGVSRATDGGIYSGPDAGTQNGNPVYIDAGPTFSWCSESLVNGTATLNCLAGGGDGGSNTVCP